MQGAELSSQSQSNLSDVDFERISNVAKTGWGLNLESSKKPLIISRLSKRLKELKLSNFKEYCNMIESGDPVESDHFVRALTTNVTHFYREAHHFEFLETAILPKLLMQAKSGAQVRIWSAGCSTGQEPYSLAGSILSLDSAAASYDIKILGTDIDSAVLQKAQEGKYHEDECRFPSENYMHRLFRGNPDKDRTLGVIQEVRDLVTFRHLNLVQHWPISGKFDVIFCRNVVIYFDRETQANLWSRFSSLLKPSAHLFIGHSERIIDPSIIGLSTSGTTAYVKQSSTANI